MHKITSILDYEYTTKGGYITVTFDTGFTTRRKTVNITADSDKRCSITGEVIKRGSVAIYFAIKKRGYTRYLISYETLNTFLSGETPEQEAGSDIEKALRDFLKDLHSERKTLLEKDEELREALRQIKFNKNKIGRKMSVTHQLLELVTE